MASKFINAINLGLIYKIIETSERDSSSPSTTLTILMYQLQVVLKKRLVTLTPRYEQAMVCHGSTSSNDALPTSNQLKITFNKV